MKSSEDFKPTALVILLEITRRSQSVLGAHVSWPSLSPLLDFRVYTRFSEMFTKNDKLPLNEALNDQWKKSRDYNSLIHYTAVKNAGNETVWHNVPPAQ
jgi:hypothetical protein